MRLILLCFLCSSFLSAKELNTFTGKAYNEKGEHIFTEEYEILKDEDTILSVTTKFSDPEGNLIGNMHSKFSEKPFLPEVSFKKEAVPFEYGTLLLEKSIELFKSSSVRPLTKKTLEIQKNMVAGHGFYFYILDELDEMLSGDHKEMVFLQPNKLDAYHFKMSATKDEKDDDLAHVTLKIEGKLLKLFVPEIHLTIHRPTKQILVYEGLSGFLPGQGSLKKISINYSQLISKKSS